MTHSRSRISSRASTYRVDDYHDRARSFDDFFHFFSSLDRFHTVIGQLFFHRND